MEGETTLFSIPLPPTSQKPKLADPLNWDAQRPLIKKLYLDENRPLTEVMKLMKRDQGFSATIKMYKNKITLWHFDKNNKTREMKAIVHRKRNRDAAGKSSTFRVRGKVVDCSAVSRYLKKKNVLEDDFALGPESPTLSVLSGLSCLTPSAPGVREESPLPSYEERIAEQEVTRCQHRDFMNDEHLLYGEQGAPGTGSRYFSRSRAMYQPLITNTSSLTYTPAGESLADGHPYHEYIKPQWTGPRLGTSYSSAINTRRPRGQPYHSIPISPETPATYLLPERLFFDVNRYIQHYVLGTFKFQTRISSLRISSIATSVGSSLFSVTNVKWYTRISQACNLFALNRATLAGHHLRQAFYELESEFSDENPDILGSTLRVLDELGAWYERHDLSQILIRHFSNLAAIKLGSSHPLIPISRCLDLTHTKDIRDTCQTVLYRAHEMSLGPDHIMTLCTRFDSIYNLLGRKDWIVAERLLWKLLHDVEMSCGIGSPLVHKIKHDLLFVIIEQNKFEEAKSSRTGGMAMLLPLLSPKYLKRCRLNAPSTNYVASVLQKPDATTLRRRGYARQSGCCRTSREARGSGGRGSAVGWIG